MLNNGSNVTSLSGVSHVFADGTTLQFPDFDLSKGETILIIGNSGVGKTTLLHILAGLLKPSKGEVTLNGKNIYRLSSRQLDTIRGADIGVVFQRPHFLNALTAYQNLSLAHRLTRSETETTYIDTLLVRLNLSHRKNAYPQTLSQGELQRLSIARAFVAQPQLVLADEPTSALDDLNTESVVALLKSVQMETHSAMIIVTHDSRLKSSFDHVIDLSTQKTAE